MQRTGAYREYLNTGKHQGTLLDSIQITFKSPSKVNSVRVMCQNCQIKNLFCFQSLFLGTLLIRFVSSVLLYVYKFILFARITHSLQQTELQIHTDDVTLTSKTSSVLRATVPVLTFNFTLVFLARFSFDDDGFLSTNNISVLLSFSIHR